jgi:hypothetical protein
MDEDRRIRFLISPLIFLGSLAVGVKFDQRRTYTDLIPDGILKLDNFSQVLALLTGGGITMIALGVLIGIATHVLLGMLRLGSAKTYEIWVDGQVSEMMLRRVVRAPLDQPPPQLFIGVTFAEDVLRKEHEHVHKWIARRWNVFSIAATSITALLLSLLVGVTLLRIAFCTWWCALVVIIAAFFLAAAWMAWRDTMDMLTFQAQRLNG